MLDRTIRVLLLDETDACHLAVEDSFELVDAETRKHLAHARPMPQLTVRFERGRVLFSELGKSFSSRVVDLVPKGNKPVQIVMQKGPRRYRGSFRFLQDSAGSGLLLNLVDIEDYLSGVVSAEMLTGFGEQAFRAHAIAARTYAWYQKQTAGVSRDWDVKATEESQVYVGIEKEGGVPEAAPAVRDTRGVVCTWSAPEGERIFCTYYSSTCGGSTQDAGPVKNEASIPPLAGNVLCDYCRGSPAYRWGPVRVSKSVITQRLRDRYKQFRAIGDIVSMQVVERTAAGRPVRFILQDAQRRAMELEAENFRLAVDPTGREVKSTFFTPLVESDAIVFQDGRGFGHGIGLCQYGADGLARAGRTAGEILSFYYPSSHLTRAY